MFFSITPLPQRTGAILRPIERRSLDPDQAPVIDPLAIAQDVAKESVELLRAGLVQGTCAQRFEHVLTLRFPDRSHDAVVFTLVPGDKIARGPRNVPAIQEPERLGKLGFAHPLQSFIAIA